MHARPGTISSRVVARKVYISVCVFRPLVCVYIAIRFSFHGTKRKSEVDPTPVVCTIPTWCCFGFLHALLYGKNKKKKYSRDGVERRYKVGRLLKKSV